MLEISTITMKLNRPGAIQTEYFEGVVEGWINNAKQKIPTHIKNSLYPELRLFDFLKINCLTSICKSFLSKVSGQASHIDGMI